MSALVALTVGMAFWISAWAFGIKSFDAFMVTVAITLVAVTAKAARPLVDRLLNRDAPAAPRN